MGFNVSVTIEINTYPMVPSVFFSLVSTLKVNYNRSRRQQIDIYHGDNSVNRATVSSSSSTRPHTPTKQKLYEDRSDAVCLSVQGNSNHVKFLFSLSAKKHLLFTQQKRGLIFQTSLKDAMMLCCRFREAADPLLNSQGKCSRRHLLHLKHV